MKKVPTHADYPALVEHLQEAVIGVTTGSMFGMPCAKRGGKAWLGAAFGGVVFKLTGQAHTDALALDGAELFDPSGKGKPMKAWVVVPAEQKEHWFDLGQKALAQAD